MTSQALIRNESVTPFGVQKWSHRVAGLALIVAATMWTFWPTLHNDFLLLGFDDAIILDTTVIRKLTLRNLVAMTTEFNHAHYMPATLLSLSLDHHFWGLNPQGYHLTNILLHSVAATLACVFLWPVLHSVSSATLAALIFALHPLQMEAVSLAIQRKTLLSGSLFFLTLILYQRWLRSQKCRYYVGAIVSFAVAALAKPIVITLPLILLLYEYAFADGRIRLVNKLPFFAIAIAAALVTVAAHSAIGATHPPHGGTVLSHVLMMSRVALEYVTACFLPINLSPIYYYPLGSGYAALNAVALAFITTVGSVVVFRRQRYPWSFFCIGWFALTLLPESNLVPLAQLRADRFLYLGLLSVGVWVAIAIHRLSTLHLSWSKSSLLSYALGLFLVTGLATMTHASAGVWRNDITAWSRVVERHPWSAMAHTMLGRAYLGRNDMTHAESAFLHSLQLNSNVPEPHLELARIYHARGQDHLAGARLRRFLELAPEDSRGLALLAAIQKADGS